jgi:hypothetical protein
MQAITTKFHGPTDHKGARISAQCEAGRVTVSYDYGRGQDGAHDEAARALIAKLGWQNNGAIWFRGHAHNGGCVYVCAHSTHIGGDSEGRTEFRISNHAFLAMHEGA